MVTFPWQEILNEPGGQAVRQGGDIARRLFCEFRRDYPYLFDAARFTAASLGSVLSNESLWNRICRDVPLSAPVGAVAGGQCPVFYNVRCFFTSPTTGASAGSSLRNFVQGPIARLSAEEFPGTVSGTSSYRVTIQDALGNVFVDPVSTNQTVRNALRRWQVDRSDTLPDNCGNGTPVRRTVPISPPTLPSTVNINRGDFTNVSSPITFNDYDGSNWPSFSFSPDITIAPFRYRALPEGLDITVDPELSLAFVPPVPVVGLPEIILTAGEILSAVTVLAPVINAILDLASGTDVDLTEIERLIRCCSCGENDQVQSESLFGSSQGGVFAIPSDTVSVELLLSDPVSSRTPRQAGNGGSQDVYHWGWYSFGRTLGSSGERNPLQFKRGSILVPQGAKSFEFAAHYGNSASASIIRIVRDCS